jgi:site-specific recombinase XerD
MKVLMMIKSKVDKNTQIMQSISAYLSEKASTGSLSKNTIINRKYELNRFYNFCKSHNIIFVGKIHKNAILRYLKSLNVSKSTKVTIMHILSAYMDFLVQEGAILENYAAILEKPRNNYPEADYLEFWEVEKLFQTEAGTATPKTVDRNLLLMSLFFTLCLRASEAVTLKMNDVRLELKQIWIRRKGGHIAKLPLNDDITGQFLNWYTARENYAGANSKWVFLSSRGNPLTTRQARYVVSNALERARICKRKNGTHLLRHSGATLRLKNGEDIKVIQYILGHRSLATTEKYLHFNEKDLKEMVDRSPKLI